jgi:replicative DNA helicase
MSPTISNMAPFSEAAQLLLRSVKVTEARVNQDGVPRSLNVAYYADIVREDAHRRHLAHLGRRLQAGASSGNEDPAAIAAAAEADLAVVKNAHAARRGRLRGVHDAGACHT